MRCNLCKKEIKGKVAYYQTEKYHPDCLVDLKYKHIIQESKENPTKTYWKKRYLDLINDFKKLELEINNKTIKQYYLIQKAYSVGIKINERFNYTKLSNDLNISLHHLKRLISLKNCTEWTWKQIKEGKISANKVCIITYEKGKANQEEVVEWAIRTKASNIEIHNYVTTQSKSLDKLTDNLKIFERDLNRISNKLESINFRDLTNEKRNLIVNSMVTIKYKIENILGDLNIQ